MRDERWRKELSVPLFPSPSLACLVSSLRPIRGTAPMFTTKFVTPGVWSRLSIACGDFEPAVGDVGQVGEVGQVLLREVGRGAAPRRCREPARGDRGVGVAAPGVGGQVGQP